jgi:hypothetical protein
MDQHYNNDKILAMFNYESAAETQHEDYIVHHIKSKRFQKLNSNTFPCVFNFQLRKINGDDLLLNPSTPSILVLEVMLRDYYNRNMDVFSITCSSQPTATFPKNNIACFQAITPNIVLERDLSNFKVTIDYITVPNTFQEKITARIWIEGVLFELNVNEFENVEELFKTLARRIKVNKKIGRKIKFYIPEKGPHAYLPVFKRMDYNNKKAKETYTIELNTVFLEICGQSTLRDRTVLLQKTKLTAEHAITRKKNDRLLANLSNIRGNKTVALTTNIAKMTSMGSNREPYLLLFDLTKGGLIQTDNRIFQYCSTQSPAALSFQLKTLEGRNLEATSDEVLSFQLYFERTC